MKISSDQNHKIEISISKKEYETITDWISTLVDKLPGLKVLFPHQIVFNSVFSKKDKEYISNIIRCYYIIKSRDMSRNYYPQTAQIATNMQEDVQEWKDVPLLRKYHNDRLSFLADPEFLIIYWCKNFENFDSNQNCLLPSYPKSIFGSNFTPLEIKTVCERMIFYWMINDQISETESRKRFQELIPFLHDLVFTEDGFRILKYSFDLINDNAVKYSELLVNIRDTKLKLFLKEHDRIGVFSQGMPKPVIKTGCVLGLFLTFSYYYLPHTMEIYHVDTNVVNYFQRVTEKYHQELLNKSRVFYEFDYDYKLKKTIKKPIYFRFYCKDRISKINLFLGKPGYTTFLNTLQPILWCSVRSDKFK